MSCGGFLRVFSMENFVIELSPEEEKVRTAIEGLLDSEGFELVKLKLKRTQAKSILALFIDTKAQENGIIMDNLQDLSHLMSDVLDAAFPEDVMLKGRYDLEVSSPGLDRPLSKASHFSRALNQRVKIRLKVANDAGSKNFMGVLTAVHDGSVVVTLENQESVSINFADMADAHIVFDFSLLDKNKKKVTKK